MDFQPPRLQRVSDSCGFNRAPGRGLGRLFCLCFRRRSYLLSPSLAPPQRRYAPYQYPYSPDSFDTVLHAYPPAAVVTGFPGAADSPRTLPSNTCANSSTDKPPGKIRVCVQLGRLGAQKRGSAAHGCLNSEHRLTERSRSPSVCSQTYRVRKPVARTKGEELWQPPILRYGNCS